MQPQLQTITDELQAALGRLQTLAQSITDHRQWTERPEPARWSVGECIAHVNLTSLAYVPIVQAGLAEARRLGRPAPANYRFSPVGWLLWKTMGPPVRFRAKTIPAWVPNGSDPPEKLVPEFDRLQAEQLAWVRAADGLPIGDVRVASPFNAKVKYNLYACLAILPRHQHRHLWQAEQALRSISSSRSAA
jgi:hypothetical protein